MHLIIGIAVAALLVAVHNSIGGKAQGEQLCYGAGLKGASCEAAEYRRKA